MPQPAVAHRARGLAVGNRSDDRSAGAHVVEEFIGQRPAEQRRVLVRQQARVGTGEPGRHVALGNRAGETHVGQAELRRTSDQIRLAVAVADERQVDARIRPQAAAASSTVNSEL